MPDIMLLDEPSSNLDWKAIGELKTVIEKWKADGKTIVISEHRLWYLKDLVDRVIFLENGHILHEWDRETFRAMQTDELQRFGLRPITIEEQYIREFSGDIFSSEQHSSVSGFDNALTIHDLFFTYHPKKYVLFQKKLSAQDADSYTLSIPELRLPKGSVIGLIGRNGAGKSTFLRCLCGLEKSCPVLLEIDGKTCSGKEILQACYMVMQDVNHQLFTDSVEAEVLLSMRNEDKNHAQELISELGLSGYENTHPMALSGGQKQRVAICSALAADAEILLFDEPTSGLDHAHMKTVAHLLQMLAERGKTVIVSTHDPELISLCCQFLICLEHGRVRYVRKV
jgi:energy-coupling factor transport system ATP-binding protein